MSEIDQKLAYSEAQIAEVQRLAHALEDAAKARPSVVSARDVELMERLLAAWRSHRTSVSNHPEFRERAKDVALKQATGRDEEV